MLKITKGESDIMIGDFNVAFWFLLLGMLLCLGGIILDSIEGIILFNRERTLFRDILIKFVIEFLLGLIFIVSGLLVKFICGVDIDIILLIRGFLIDLILYIIFGLILFYRIILDFGITRRDSSSFEKENEYEKK